MIGARDVVILAGVEWEPLWQSPHEVAAHLAAAGHRILFVENSGVRAPRLGDAGRIAHRLRAGLPAPGRPAARKARPGIRVLAPLVLPPFGGSVTRAANRRVFIPRVARAARRLGFRAPDIWTWLPTDNALGLISELRGPDSRIVYFCVSDFEALATRPGRLRAAERALVATSTLTLAHSPSLLTRLEAFGGSVHAIGPGVDLTAFPAAEVPTVPATQPTIGYVGSLHRFVDVELVERCASERPDWRWVLVGPAQRDCSALQALPNVHLVGARPHAELSAHIAGFDVCIAPYTLERGIQDVLPTKVGEYLAVGRPVVATPLPAIVDFQRQHGVLEVAAPEPDAFLAGIERALAGALDAAAARRRRQVAALSSWPGHLERITEWLDAATASAPPRPARPAPRPPAPAARD